MRKGYRITFETPHGKSVIEADSIAGLAIFVPAQFAGVFAETTKKPASDQNCTQRRRVKVK